MNSPVDHAAAMVGRSAEKMSLNKLKNSVTLERRYRAKYDSKYRHKPYFSSSNGHRIIIRGLPLWASILILIAAVIVALFIVGFIAGFIRERSRSQKSGKSMRWKKVFLSALSVALFLWIPIYIIRFIKNRKGKGGSYAEIDEDKQRLNATATTEATKPWNMNRASADAGSRYEPMGYQSSVYDPYSAYAGVNDPSVVGHAQPSPSGVSSKEAEAARSVSPVGATGFHQPPPLQESGDLGSRSPSPPRASFSPAHPPPTYNA